MFKHANNTANVQGSTIAQASIRLKFSSL